MNSCHARIISFLILTIAVVNVVAETQEESVAVAGEVGDFVAFARRERGGGGTAIHFEAGSN